MRSLSRVLGGLLFFSLVGVSLAFAPIVAADEPFLASTGGEFLYYVRNPITQDGKLVSGERYLVPREDIRPTWGIATVPVRRVLPEDLVKLPLRGTIAYGPGTLIQVPDDYKVYVVTRGRILRYIDSESTAARHFGRDWVSKIKHVPSSWLPHYRFGKPIVGDTWLSDKELEVSIAALFESTDPAWRENVAALRDRERLGTIQGTIIPFLYQTMRVEGNPAPFVHGKWLLGGRGRGWMYGTDTVNNTFRKVPTNECKNLQNGVCIDGAPDAQINTHLCGVQAPYGYQNSFGGFELSFCIESSSAMWQPRADDFDDATAPMALRPGWYKYTVRGLERISS